MPAVHDPSLVSQDLIEFTRALGDPAADLAILAEGNSSTRLSDGRLVVKASGSNLLSVTEQDFVVVDVDPLVALMTDDASTQRQLTAELDAGLVDGVRKRGSIEALVHAAVHALAPDGSAPLYVGHTHPTAVVGLLASVVAETAWSQWVYSDEAVVIGRPLYVPYAQPGIDLGRIYYRALADRVQETGAIPELILLGNHGIVATSATAAGVLAISAMAVKGARVRTAAYSVGGVAPLPAESVAKFFARDDIVERRGNLVAHRS